MANKEIDEQEKKEPSLQPEDMLKLCIVLLHILGGKASVPKETFDNFPKAERIDYQYDTETKRWIFTVPRKRKKGILTRQKRIII